MKKILFTIILTVVCVSIYAQTTPLTVAFWIGLERDVYRERVNNELIARIENSEEFNFKVINTNTDYADFHLVLRAIPLEEHYAWALGITPLRDARFTNAFVFWTEPSISGMNWAARHAVQRLEEMIYVMFDVYVQEEALENSSLGNT